MVETLNSVAFISDEAVCQAMSTLLEQLRLVQEDDQNYERMIREAFVMGDSALTEPQANALFSDVIAYACMGQADVAVLMPSFYACFEWTNRREDDPAVKMTTWDRLFSVCGGQLSTKSLYQYALSRRLLAKGDDEGALIAAGRAKDIAGEHIGFLNNYSEILLSHIEDALLEGRMSVLEEPGTSREAIAGAIVQFEKLLKSQVAYPSFYRSMGRLNACIGQYDKAQDCFDSARSLLTSMHNQGHKRFASESDYLGEVGSILEARSKMAALRNAVTTWESLEATRKELAAREETVRAGFDEVNEKIEGERINMLEFLGFFCGVISFIMASLSIGEGMDFADRAALIVVMLGALLTAFGSFGWLLEGMRSSKSTMPKGELRASLSNGTLVLAAIGIFLVIFAFVMRAILG